MARHAGGAEVSEELHVFVPTNRAYTSERNWGRPAPMDGLNEIVDSNRANRYEGAKVERENVTHVASFVRSAMRKAGWRRMTMETRRRCVVRMEIVEPHDRRDVPNVIGGVSKYALDALTATNPNGCGAIWDDKVKWVEFHPTVVIEPGSPGIYITIIR